MKISGPIFYMTGVFCTTSSYIIHNKIGHPMIIDDHSMTPTLNLNPGEVVWISKLAKPKEEDGKIVWVSKRAKKFRGNIFMFSPPTDPSRNDIKRIAGVPGDFLSCPNHGPQHAIPSHYFWMLSDNRTIPTVDSEQYGWVHQSLLKGKATFVIWPPSKWSKL